MECVRPILLCLSSFLISRVKDSVVQFTLTLTKNSFFPNPKERLELLSNV